MKIISLGYTCYVRGLLQKTPYRKEVDVFDWMNTFSFEKLIDCLENECDDILDKLIISPLSIDNNNPRIYFNERYNLRLPHESNITLSKDKYKRRYNRFCSYNKDEDTYIFIRQICMGRYGIPGEDLNIYNDTNYERLAKFLPPNHKILLITDCKLSQDDKDKISNKYYIVDDSISVEHIAYGEYMKYSKRILQLYVEMFDYINAHFNTFTASECKEFIKNERIGIT